MITSKSQLQCAPNEQELSCGIMDQEQKQEF
jgi:hypothetical protein